VIVATVLRSGGDYTLDHVARIREMIKQYVPSHTFVCLSDLDGSLEHNWPGWWSKMELFKLKGPVLYFDLDTILVRDMTQTLESVKGHEFVIMRDVYRGKSDHKAMQSSVMYWSGDMSRIYADYAKNPEFKEGDQDYLEKVITKATYWQDVTKGIVSFKADVLKRGLSPTDECVVFHGKPRPWEQNVIQY
jgi:hypothetical protein